MRVSERRTEKDKKPIRPRGKAAASRGNLRGDWISRLSCLEEKCLKQKSATGQASRTLHARSMVIGPR